jgi:hypothetical protein
MFPPTALLCVKQGMKILKLQEFNNPESWDKSPLVDVQEMKRGT